MTVRPAHRWLAAAAAVLLVSCSPALKPPPPVSVLGERSGADTSAVAGSADVDRLLARAEDAFARRPDRVAVTAALAAFLAAARADESRVEGLLGATRVWAWTIEHEADGGRRTLFATEAVQAGQWCVTRAPSSVACRYRLALALGQQARERRTTAMDGLSRMVALLEEVAAQDPLLDRAGADRVLALVRLRAPGWPAGPGDRELALEHARRADQLVADDADNLLVLGEALAKTGAAVEARAAYERAERLARERLAAGDPDAPDLIDSATRALESLR